MEGITGFGIPAMLIAPMLLVLGYKPLTCVVMPLAATTTAVTFGALGTPLKIGLGIFEPDSVVIYTLFLNALPVLLLPFFLAYIYEKTEQTKLIWPDNRKMLLGAGVIFAFIFMVVGLFTIEYVSVISGIVGLIIYTSNFVPKNESLFYSKPEAIMKTFGKNRIPSIEFAQQFVSKKGDNKSEKLANHVYKSTDGNSEPGDGFKYRGRGFIQHTGKNQYAALAKGSGIDLLSNPDALNSPEIAAKVIPWFFLSYKKMKPEDVENMSKVNKAIAFADPTGQKALAREKSSEQIYASMSGSSGTQVASASSEVASAQRQQQKPSTPIVVNAPTTNTTVISKTQTASAPPPKNTANALVARAA
jgi:predicted chitinase